jgi:rare lipoprotein A
MFNKQLGIGIACGVFALAGLIFGTPVSAADEEAAGDKDAKKGGNSFSGNVSWYGPGLQGKKTASGEQFDMNKPTAAHLKLPFGTRVLVEDPRSGKTVILKVNDRGPFVKTRVMDMAKEGAKRLGTLNQGVIFVDCLVVPKSSGS